MSSSKTVQLGLNIDHVATVRQARQGLEPNLVQAALEGIRGGACGITVHLREDRRHIQNQDVFDLKRAISVPLNLEMSLSEEIVGVARKLKPEKACLVPERRQELTTEGGLNVLKERKRLEKTVKTLKEKGVVVSLFVDPVFKHVRIACEVGADFIELHTGSYAHRTGRARAHELARLKEAAYFAHSLGLGVNAGHGLNYENVKPIARLPHMEELNIGHSIISRAVFVGIKEAVREMCRLIKTA